VLGSRDGDRPSDESGHRERTVEMGDGSTGLAADEETGGEIWSVNLQIRSMGERGWVNGATGGLTSGRVRRLITVGWRGPDRTAAVNFAGHPRPKNNA